MHRVVVKKHNYTCNVQKTYQLYVSALSSWAIIRLDTIIRGTIVQYNTIISVSVSGRDEISFAKSMEVCV